MSEKKSQGWFKTVFCCLFLFYCDIINKLDDNIGEVYPGGRYDKK